MTKKRGRGRPKKSESGYKGKSYGFFDNRQAQLKDATIIRSSKQANDFKFNTYDELLNSIYKYLSWGVYNCPFGIVMKSCDQRSEYMIDNLVYQSRYNKEYRKSLAILLTDMFEDTVKNYNRNYSVNNVKNIAYKITVYFDMRRYANNLSIIYQIINDIHYNFFNNHLACYILNGDNEIREPLFSLTIYVSNVCVDRRSYLSTSFAYDFDYMKAGVKQIINKNLQMVTNNGKSDISVVPLFIDESFKPDNKVKPAGMKYIDWYKQLYGDSIMKDPALNNIVSKIK